MGNSIFEWDEVKALQNERKHGLTFEEGLTVFNDPFAITVSDSAHSGGEERWVDIGVSNRGKLLVVWYTEREDGIRIIGCRKASKNEQRIYEHG